MNKLIRDKNFHILNLISIVSVFTNVLNPSFRAIAEAFQVTPDQVGLLTTVYTIPIVILSPVVGIASDRFGRKKVLGISALIFGLSAVVSIMSTSYSMLMFSEFLRGIGQPGLVIVAIVLIGDLYGDTMRKRVMGINMAVMNAGLAVLPIVGGVLAGISWKYPYFVILLAIPVALIAFAGLDEPEVKKEKEKMIPYLKGALIHYREGRVIAISVISMSVYALLSGCFLVYAAFILEDPSWIGIIFAVMALASCLSSLFVEKLIKLAGEENLVRLTFLIFAISFIIGANAGTTMVAMIFSGVFGLGIGIIMPVQNIILLPLAPDNERGAFISIQNLIHEVGQALGPIAFGYIFVKFDLSGVFYGAAILSAVILLIALKFLRKVEK